MKNLSGKVFYSKWLYFLVFNKLRKLIVDEGFTSKAFVSIRLMQSVQKTYNVFRQVVDQSGQNLNFVESPDISFTPADVYGARNSKSQFC